MVKADWSKVGGSYRVYETGTYRVKIKEVQESKASTGTLQLKWQAEILECEDESLKGETITTFTPIEDRKGGDTAIWRSLNMIDACGIDTKNLPVMDTEGPAFKRIYKACEGNTVYWYVTKTKNPSGKDKNEVEATRDEANEVVDVDVDKDEACPF